MAYDELRQILARFDHAMLVSRDEEGGLRSRPMAVAGTEQDGCLWFMTSAASGKCEELERDPHVNVAMQARGVFLSVSGRARMLHDRERAAALWSEKQRVWFPGGPGDESLLLLEVVPRMAEYWDRAGVRGLLFAFAEARAVLTHGELDDAGRHAKIGFENDDG